MAKNPDDRPPTAAHFTAELAAVLGPKPDPVIDGLDLVDHSATVVADQPGRPVAARERDSAPLGSDPPPLETRTPFSAMRTQTGLAIVSIGVTVIAGLIVLLVINNLGQEDNPTPRTEALASTAPTDATSDTTTPSPASIVFSKHTDSVEGIAVLSDDRIVSAGLDGTVRIRDPDNL